MTENSTRISGNPAQHIPVNGSPPIRPSRAHLRFSRIALTIVHLVALSVVGSVVGSVVVALLTAGISTLVVFGLGVFFIIGTVYVLFATAWSEYERVGTLYGFTLPPLRFQTRRSPGFGGWLMSVSRQSVDGRMWLALVNFALGAIMGSIVLLLVTLAIWNVTLTLGGRTAGEALGEWRFFGLSQSTSAPAESSFWASPWWSVLFALVLCAAVWGIAVLHTLISRALLGTVSRTELTAQVHTKNEQRAGAVRAADVERTRIERDLHDGVQPRLVSIAMTLGLAQQKIEADPALAKSLLNEAHTSVKAAITELRQLARGIHTAVLDDRGLDAALSALAGRSHIPVRLDVHMPGADELRRRSQITPPGNSPGTTFRDAEAAIYFSIAEALTNAAKHSRAAECRVQVRLRDPGTPNAALYARIEDNGIGGALVQPGGGLDGITHRALAAGGHLRLDSPVGGPTVLEVTVPCAF